MIFFLNFSYHHHAYGLGEHYNSLVPKTIEEETLKTKNKGRSVGNVPREGPVRAGPAAGK